MYNPFEMMQNMMNQDNNFNNMFMKNMKMPEMANMSNMNDMIKKNMESISSANQMVAESLQSIAKRGADSFQKNATEMFNSVKQAVSAGDMDQLNNSGQKYFKSTLENNINNAKEIIDVASKSSIEILDLFGKNLNDNLSNLQKKQKNTQ